MDSTPAKSPGIMGNATALCPPLVFERTPGAASRPLPAKYRRRRPEATALHRVVRDHVQDLLAEARRRYDSGAGFPPFVEHEFSRYLACGMLQHGFARLRCPSCGTERLVAFSCKGRLCPSCWAHRAADTAADLVDRVLPEARYRQWVLTLPWEMRYHLATDKGFLSRVLTTFQRTVAAWLRRRARQAGLPGGETGAVTFIQRFGGILNLNPHFHTVFLDGVFVEGQDGSDGPRVFQPVPTPTDHDIEALALRLAQRLGKLARRRFEQASEELETLDTDTLPLRSVSAEAIQIPGPRAPRHQTDIFGEGPPDDQGGAAPGHKPLCARINGFSLHAARVVESSDRDGLERLCRYGLRAPFSQDRLSLTTDGQVRYRLHRPWPTPAGRTEIVLEPVAFLRRLATLLPAPYQNLVRYHGVFANRSRYRKALPHPPARLKNARGDDNTPGDRQPPNVPVAPKPEEFRKRTHPSWAALLHRALHVDALSCPRCATPMVVLAFLTDPAVVTRILDHLHLPSTVPTIAPARDPDDLWAMDDHGVREPTSGYGVVGRLALRRRRPGARDSRHGPAPARDPPAVTIS